MIDQDTNLPYLLYDNVTLHRGSRDWGLKRATGWLADNQNLQDAFRLYSHNLLSHSGCPLTELDGAVGGLPNPSSKTQYLICVSLSRLDWYERDSLAIVGIGFQDRGNLYYFLNDFDPVKTARQILDNELPNALNKIGNAPQLDVTTRNESVIKISSSVESAFVTKSIINKSFDFNSYLPSIFSWCCSCHFLDQLEYNITYIRPLSEEVNKEVDERILNLKKARLVKTQKIRQENQARGLESNTDKIVPQKIIPEIKEKKNESALLCILFIAVTFSYRSFYIFSFSA